MSPPDYDADDGAPGETGEGVNAPRPYVGVYFECCGVYARIYRQPHQQLYLGRCPHCLRTVRLRVGPDGTTARLFRAR